MTKGMKGFQNWDKKRQLEVARLGGIARAKKNRKSLLAAARKGGLASAANRREAYLNAFDYLALFKGIGIGVLLVLLYLLVSTYI